MESILQLCLMFFTTAVLLVLGIIFFAPHLIIPLAVKCVILISPFKKKWILLDNNMWCSYLEKGGIQSSTNSILFLHGLSGSGVDFVKCASYLDKSTHIICLNILNHADTASFTREVEVNDIVQYVSEFVKKSSLQQRRFHIAGFSMGGLISVIYSSRHPESIASLILINSAGMCENSEIVNLATSGIITHQSNKDLYKLINHMSSGTVPQPPSIMLTALRYHKNNTSVREGYVLRGLTKHHKIEVSVLQTLANVKVMYLQGDLDVVTPKAGADFFIEHVPHTELRIINGGAHTMLYTHMDNIYIYIKDWLEITSVNE